MPEYVDLETVRDVIAASSARYVDELVTLASIDSGTFDKDGNDAVGRALGDRYRALGMEVEVHPQAEYGDIVVARREGRGVGRVLLLGHTDTVYPAGTVAERGVRQEGDRLYGPGTADMKAGDLAVVYALGALFDVGFEDFGRIEVVHNTDEEIGSPASHDLIYEHSLEADAVFVLEAARENGDIVSARKGIAQAQIQIHGRSAHAGVNHERGRSAALEMAHLVVALEGINGTISGVTLNVGRLEAGDRINVVPDSASICLEVRSPDRLRLDAVMDRIAEVVRRRTVPETEVELVQRVNHYPMHKSAGGQQLVDLARSLGNTLGFRVSDTATGGASDGNTAAAAGRPVLDGLGPIGGGAHSVGEWLLVPSIVPRVTLLAGLVAHVGAAGMPE